MEIFLATAREHRRRVLQQEEHNNSCFSTVARFFSAAQQKHGIANTVGPKTLTKRGERRDLGHRRLEAKKERRK